MAKITRIKASDTPRDDSHDEPTITRKKVTLKDKKQKKAELKSTKRAAKQISDDNKTQQRKTFILFRPFVALFCYIRDSWRELKQVRWPNRKATWKMVLAVIVYSALFMLLISLLDLFFTWLFSKILG